MKKARSGSAMSTKQLARTVFDGRKVTFSFPPSQVCIEGYLCGMDDFHWMVITPGGKKHLIHKGGASVISLSDESTYANEPRLVELESVVAPFRAAMEADVLGRQPVPASN